MIAARLAEARLALVLLTRLPGGRMAQAPALGATAWAWPLAGAVVGLGQGAVLAAGLALGLPPAVAAWLAVAAGLALTGGLHEDGLADLTDGLSGGRSTARRLEIMRDSRIGSHGAAALIVALGLRSAVFAALTDGAALALPVAAMLSRATMPALLVTLPQARREGLGAAAMAGIRGKGALMAAALAVLPALLLLGLAALPVALAAAAAAALTGWLALRRLGGITGDVLGAAQVVAELAALIAWLALTG